MNEDFAQNLTRGSKASPVILRSLLALETQFNEIFLILPTQELSARYAILRKRKKMFNIAALFPNNLQFLITRTVKQNVN